MMSSTANTRLLRSVFGRIIVKELMCYPCVRTPVTHVSILYKGEGNEVWVSSYAGTEKITRYE